jgi:hypothetical protein
MYQFAILYGARLGQAGESRTRHKAGRRYRPAHKKPDSPDFQIT